MIFSRLLVFSFLIAFSTASELNEPVRDFRIEDTEGSIESIPSSSSAASSAASSSSLPIKIKRDPTDLSGMDWRQEAVPVQKEEEEEDDHRLETQPEPVLKEADISLDHAIEKRSLESESTETVSVSPEILVSAVDEENRAHNLRPTASSAFMTMGVNSTEVNSTVSTVSTVSKPFTGS